MSRRQFTAPQPVTETMQPFAILNASLKCGLAAFGQDLTNMCLARATDLGFILLKPVTAEAWAMSVMDESGATVCDLSFAATVKA